MKWVPIVYIKDIQNLKANMDNLEKICDLKTPMVTGLFENRIKRKLRRNIQNQASKENADLAVITSFFDHYPHPFTQRTYSFTLYKYPK